MKTWTLSPKGEKRFLAGHPWVFSNELQHSPKGIEPGELIELVNLRGQFLAQGYGNPGSLIAFRTLSRTEDSEIRALEWVPQRLLEAAQFRERLGRGTYSFRLCFSEADSLPGLIIDRYLLADDKGQVFVVQILTAGMERLLNDVSGVLERFVSLARQAHLPMPTWEKTSIVLKSDSRSRALEGLSINEAQLVKSLEDYDLTQARICVQAASSSSSPLIFRTDLMGGQKTGFFLDQATNIELLLAHAKAPREPGQQIKVLDLFSYVGQWGAQVARHYKNLSVPVEVWSVDASENALSFARENIEAEGAKVESVKMDIVEKAGQLPPASFDIVICDPPALIKAKKDIAAGQRAYVKVNTSALRALKAGGIFISCSCSQHLGDNELLDVLTQAQRKAQRSMVWVGHGMQAPDHPMLLEFPQGSYLKSWLGVSRSTNQET